MICLLIFDDLWRFRSQHLLPQSYRIYPNIMAIMAIMADWWVYKLYQIISNYAWNPSRLCISLNSAVSPAKKKSSLLLLPVTSPQWESLEKVLSDTAKSSHWQQRQQLTRQISVASSSFSRCDHAILAVWSNLSQPTTSHHVAQRSLIAISVR